jgi:hypothetical protein
MNVVADHTDWNGTLRHDLKESVFSLHYTISADMLPRVFAVQHSGEAKLVPLAYRT